MKKILKKLLLAVLAVALLIFVAEKILIPKQTMEVSENETMSQQPETKNQTPKEEEAYQVLVIGNSLTIE